MPRYSSAAGLWIISMCSINSFQMSPFVAYFCLGPPAATNTSYLNQSVLDLSSTGRHFFLRFLTYFCVFYMVSNGNQGLKT